MLKKSFFPAVFVFGVMSISQGLNVQAESFQGTIVKSHEEREIGTSCTVDLEYREISYHRTTPSHIPHRAFSLIEKIASARLTYENRQVAILARTVLSAAHGYTNDLWGINTDTTHIAHGREILKIKVDPFTLDPTSVIFYLKSNSITHYRAECRISDNPAEINSAYDLSPND